ncbi:RNase adapter RapZ [Kiloniella sp. b19]|uniref:RNase adapter RapZ n=1 Tax=Kiloniella sp. GXU_MW_B19 TaxID=3141326 RepID=UPI0031DB8179
MSEETAPPNPQARRVILVSGLSGAGRSTALKALEDVGFEAIDNLPLSLIDRVVEGMDDATPLALGIDARSRHFTTQNLTQHVLELKARKDLNLSFLFMTCSDQVLERRFKETRRQHPMADGRPLRDGIAAERRLLVPLQENADLVIDSSAQTPAEFKLTLAAQLGLNQQNHMTVQVLSFSFRFGIPTEADLVFDVRFLRNPHYDPDLRPLTGQDKAVSDHVKSDPEFGGFSDRLLALVSPLLPRYEAEGKKHLTIAVGCTGGRHRSVTVANWLHARLKEQHDAIVLSHRDIHRDKERYQA